jgi:hypothetical protein
VPFFHQPPVVGRSVFDGRWEGTLWCEVVSWDERASPGGVGEVSGELTSRVRGGDDVAAAIEVHDRCLAVPGVRCGPQTIYGVGLFVGHTLGL